jgi:HTH-type transcriptional regulator / antitoxin HigA
MDIRPIRTPEDYEAAFEILDKHWPAEEGTEEYDYFDILSILILNYEKENRPIDLPDPIEALKYYMQQDGYSVEELGLVLKDQTLAKKLLDKTAPMTLSIVYELYKQWDYPPVPFLKPYRLVSGPLIED